MKKDGIITLYSQEIYTLNILISSQGKLSIKQLCIQNKNYKRINKVKQPIRKKRNKKQKLVNN